MKNNPESDVVQVMSHLNIESISPDEQEIEKKKKKLEKARRVHILLLFIFLEAYYQYLYHIET